ncbi:Beta-glucosidase (SUN family) domain containing protein [Hyaloscypha variabilis]|uniref:Glycoside hydrolase family 132 protein n=1 Tax=Hyaloscypha variabilis (strain UAMH 11265 / GT02V1 / F) TaxID=1149755 RepID=A0A2J6SAT2_HYAVF|nr:hypothetical protein L207DRAFT_415690 [Hyaloscypha variabilis F]
MKLLDIQAAIGTAILLLSLPCEAKHAHQLSHLDVKRHNHKHSHKSIQASPRAEGIEEVLETRSGQCAFPNDPSMVAVTPDQQNAGWAMSPNQPCLPGNWCPYACAPPGVSKQWNPAATSYVYPLSMDGGLYCDSNGNMQKGFPDQPYCEPGTGTVEAQNTCSEDVAFCQTVLPGNEAMLIPTQVGGNSVEILAVPGPDYWIESSAHFYVNTPGLTTEEACVWGDGTQALGNWAPYAVGGQTTSSGQTFYKIGWNPIYTSSSFSSVMPSFGVSIVCDGDGCEGTPCSIDPSVVGIGGVTSADQAVGAGGASFCVVTIPAGGKAKVVVFPNGGSSAGSEAAAAVASSAAPPSSSSAAPSSTTPAPKSSAAPSTSSKASHTVSELPSSTVKTTSTSATPDLGAILFQNENSTSSGVDKPSKTASSTADLTSPSEVPSTTKKSSASESFASGSILGFVILFAAAGYLL